MVSDVIKTQEANPPAESWLDRVASAAWDKGSQTYNSVSKTVRETCEEHPTVCTIAAVAAVAVVATPLARRGLDTMVARKALSAETSILTEDPFRSLIGINGYGSSKAKAVAMEKIIAAARDGVIRGDLATGKQVERFIAREYMPSMRNNPLREMTREYDEASLFPKHGRYKPALESLAGRSTHTAKVELDGKLFDGVTTVNSIDHGVSWRLPNNPEFVMAARGRVDSLFQGLITESAERSPRAMQSQVERVAEMEWLNAHTWKYARGSAGISQLESRTWLEVAGIDSGKFRAGIDPNLEALTRSLPDFKANYMSFFKKPPSYFNHPQVDLVPKFNSPEFMLKAA